MLKLRKERIVIKPKIEYVKVNEKRFDGKVSIVTGATGSIGSAIAKRLAIEGATVILTGRNEEKLKALKNDLESQSLKADYCVMDVCDEESIQKAFLAINEKYGVIDFLINNAGYSARKKKELLCNQSLEVIEELIKTNLMGSLITSKHVVSYMKNSESGRIIYISSIAGIGGKIRDSEYCSAKAGLFGLAKAQAIELGKYGITVNCVSPGLVPRSDADDEKLSNSAKATVIDKVCSPEDIASGCAFLLSNEANFITGQNLVIDGGRSLGLKGDR